MRLELLLRDIVDSIVWENFSRLQIYLAKQKILDGAWEFFEVSVPAGDSVPVKHGLTFTPKDIILLSAIGDKNFYFNYADFDSKNIYVTAAGPVRLRFMAGAFYDKAYGNDTTPLLDVPVSSGSSGAAAFDPSTGFTVYDDFANAYYAGSGQIFSENAWSTMQAGGPAFDPNGLIIPSTAAHPGVMEMKISTLGDGAAITTGLFGAWTNQAFVMGGGELSFETVIKLNALSNGANDGGINVGFMDGPGWAAPANSIYFKYQSVTSLNWYVESFSGGVGSSFTSSIPVTAGWHKLKMVINAGATSAEFFVDGTSIGTITSNIPATKLPPMVSYRKTAGNGALYLGVDYIKIDKTFTVPR
jgi:hypothetical protein